MLSPLTSTLLLGGQEMYGALYSAPYISLTDDGLARVIIMAWDKEAALVDLPSHVSDLQPAHFSPSDIYGFSDWVPHIWWRLKGKPILAMVVSPFSFDALVWRVPPDQPEALATCMQVAK